MIKAAKGITFILVDCSKPNDNTEWKAKYEARGYPTIVFVNATGKKVGNLRDRSPEGVARQFEELRKKHTMAARWSTDYKKAHAEAKKVNKPVVVIFSDPNHPATSAVEGMFADKGLEKALADVILVRHPVSKKDKLCKAFGMKKGTAVFVIDPSDKPGKARKKIRKIKSVKHLAKQLTSEIESHKKRVAKAKKAEL